MRYSMDWRYWFSRSVAIAHRQRALNQHIHITEHNFLFFLFLLWPQRDTTQPTSFHLCSLSIPLCIHFVVWRRRSFLWTTGRIENRTQSFFACVQIRFFGSTVHRIFVFFTSCASYILGRSMDRVNERNTNKSYYTHVIWIGCVSVCAGFEFKPEIPICSNAGRLALLPMVVLLLPLHRITNICTKILCVLCSRLRLNFICMPLKHNEMLSLSKWSKSSFIHAWLVIEFIS